MSVREIYFHAIDISVTPAHLAQSSRLFTELESWVNNHKLPTAYRWWENGRLAFRGVFVGWIAMFAAALLLYLLKSGVVSDNQEKGMALRHGAEAITSSGVTPQNEHEALDLLLKIQLYGEQLPTKLDENSRNVRFLTGWTLFRLFMFVPLAILCFPPTTVFGVGKGASKLGRTRIWLKIVVVLLPTFLIMRVFSSALGSMLYEVILNGSATR